MALVANPVWTAACMGSSISTETHAQSDAALALDAHLVNRSRPVRDRCRFARLRTRYGRTGARRRLDGLASGSRGGAADAHHVDDAGADSVRDHSRADDGTPADADG